MEGIVTIRAKSDDPMSLEIQWPKRNYQPFNTAFDINYNDVHKQYYQVRANVESFKDGTIVSTGSIWQPVNDKAMSVILKT